MDIRKIAEPTNMGTWELRHEEWRVGRAGAPITDDPWVPINSAWTLGVPPVYVGDEEAARHIIDNLGIVPEYRTPKSNVASIGFCHLEQRWYGWSHRAMCGFAIGDKIKKGDIIATGVTPAGFVIHTLSEARLLACLYAEAVS